MLSIQLTQCSLYVAVQTDVDRYVEITEQLWRKLGHDAGKLDISLIREFGSCAAGQICPIQAVIGGIAAQEVLKVLLSFLCYFVLAQPLCFL